MAETKYNVYISEQQAHKSEDKRPNADNSFPMRQKTQAEMDEEFYSEETNPNLMYDPMDPNVEVDEDGYRI